MSVKQVDLEIIIVNFNGRRWLQETLETLQLWYLSKTELQVVVTVVDNASTDDSVDMVQKNFPATRLIQNASNVGFAAANNVAIKESKALYVMLLNSDMVLTAESSFDELVSYLDAHPKVAVITPRVDLSDGGLDPASHRGEPTLWASATYFLGFEKKWPSSKLLGGYHQFYKNLDEVHEIDACSGAAMIVRSQAIRQVGLLDERFFMYAEDLDWCRRFRQAGWKVVFYPLVRVIHHKNKSGIQSGRKQVSQQASHHFYDTMLQYFEKHHPFAPVLKHLVRAGIKYLKKRKRVA